MRTGFPAALLRGAPSAIRDDRFTRWPFPAAKTHAPAAPARSSNTAMEHRNRCTDLRHPELLATSLLKCPRQNCCETPSETKKIGKLSPLSSFIFLALRVFKWVDLGTFLQFGQARGQDFQSEIFFVAQAVGAALKDADFVVEA